MVRRRQTVQAAALVLLVSLLWLQRDDAAGSETAQVQPATRGNRPRLRVKPPPRRRVERHLANRGDILLEDPGCSQLLLPDWQLDDDAFVQAFDALNEDDLVVDDLLALKNPFARDERITFFPRNHSFVVGNPDGTSVHSKRSVTGIVREFEHPFLVEKAIESMRNSRNWPKKQEEFRKEDGEIMTDQEIMASWKRKGDITRSRGTFMHFQIEQHLNGVAVQEPYSPEFQRFLAFEEQALQGMKVVRTEAALFHCGLGACGIADLLCRDADGRIVIVDWKRSDKIVRSNKWERMKPPLHNIQQCKFNTFQMQLNMYRYFLESEYNEEVSGMLIVQLHPTLPTFNCLKVERMEEEVESLVEHFQDMGRASEPLPGAVSRFRNFG